MFLRLWLSLFMTSQSYLAKPHHIPTFLLLSVPGLWLMIQWDCSFFSLAWNKCFINRSLFRLPAPILIWFSLFFLISSQIFLWLCHPWLWNFCKMIYLFIYQIIFLLYNMVHSKGKAFHESYFDKVTMSMRGVDFVWASKYAWYIQASKNLSDISYCFLNYCVLRVSRHILHWVHAYLCISVSYFLHSTWNPLKETEKSSMNIFFSFLH